jgi:hypothetical protein
MLQLTILPSLSLTAAEHLTSEDLDEMNIEILRNTLYKAYLDDFSKFVRRLGGTTAEVMGDLLAYEVRSAAAQPPQAARSLRPSHPPCARSLGLGGVFIDAGPVGAGAVYVGGAGGKMCHC